MVNNLSPSPILFVDHAQHLGGAEHSLLLLMQHLDPVRWQPHLACPEGALADGARQLGIPYHSLSLPRLKRSLKIGTDWLHGARALDTVAREVEARMLIANTVRATFYTAFAAKLSKRPFLWHMRDFWLSETIPHYPQIDLLLKKIMCKSANQVIANSFATANYLPCKNVTVIHNGIDLHRFSTNSSGSLFREKYNIPQEVPLIGIVGRLRPWKGQHRFIEMAASLLQTHPTAHFVIVGGSVFGDSDNGYANFLRDEVKNRNLTKNVRFTGQIEDVRDALNALDIFVHSGDPEPFGLVNIEAMASGKPVVAFAHGALPEIVQHNHTGLLVDPTDIPGLASGVINLIEATTLAKKMGMAGRERVQTLFTIEQTAVKFSSLLQAVVGASS